MTPFLKPGIHPDPVPSRGPRIPRKLWQTTRDRNAVAPELAACVDRLKAMNPGWTHQLFDDASQVGFIDAVASDRFRRAYARINPRYGAMRADMFRYLVVYLHGGAYLDLKSGATRPLDTILRPDDRFLISQWDNGPDGVHSGAGLHKAPGGRIVSEYEQWFIIAEPGHPYLAAVIGHVLNEIEGYRALRHSHGYRGVFATTGPLAYTLAIEGAESLGLHRRIHAPTEGLKYSQFGDHLAHRALDAGHYFKHVGAPVTAHGVRGRAWLAYWLSELGYWPVGTLRRLNHARLQRRRARRQARAVSVDAAKD